MSMLNGLSVDGSVSEKPSPMRGNGQHVLVAVDDPAAVELLSTTLELAGYQIDTAGCGTEAHARLMEHRFDLMVLDVTLPDMEGLSRGHRLTPAADRPPVLFLVACEYLSRLLPGLGPGASDYVTQPFRIAEVLARAQVLLRGRTPAWRGSTPYYGDLVLDDSTCQAWRGRRALDLTPAEYRLLRYLLVNAEQVISKGQIGRHVWGEVRADNAIEQLLSRLRRKVNQEQPALIHTRRGFGYWLGRPTRL
ncbi:MULTISPECIES: response regulator transcription factor [unclassified Streptomyces]|uniref:response regulator transcription factor n=2 Tax=Streptomyces TaxID=1883 RepID=UPI002E32958A|nr:response regulator transcription factor [Streptomyces sp. NBC_01356]WTB37731.1 response regulator transcription factor [Streptomyces sp. NBC_00827]